jgi:hypothetical protein
VAEPLVPPDEVPPVVPPAPESAPAVPLVLPAVPPVIPVPLVPPVASGEGSSPEHETIEGKAISDGTATSFVKRFMKVKSPGRPGSVNSADFSFHGGNLHETAIEDSWRSDSTGR